MSVINQVLVDLEKRHASNAERGILPDHVRALPDTRGDRRVPWLAAAGFAVASAAGIALWLGLSAGREPPHLHAAAAIPQAAGATPQAVVATPQAAPNAPQAPATALSTVPESMVTTATVAPDAMPRPVPRSRVELSPAPVLQLSGEAEPRPVKSSEPIAAARVLARAEATQPEPAGVAKAAAASSQAPTENAAPAVRSAKEPAQPALAPLAEKPAPAGKPGIEKQIRQVSARELADNEYRKAAGSLHQGRTQEALEGFRAAISSYPGHHGARQALVALLVESKANAEAERLLHEGIKLAPEQIGFAMTLARLQLDRGDGPGAIGTLQGSLAHAQGSPDYAAFLAALLQRQGRHDEAVEQFQFALKARPASGVWWLGLAVSLQAMNRGLEAQDAYRRAKTSNNLNPELTAFADQQLRQLQ